MIKRHWQRLCIAVVVGVFVLSFFLPACQAPFAPAGEYFLGWQACYFLWLAFWRLMLWGKGVLPPNLDLLETVCGWLPNLLFPIGSLLLMVRRNWSAMIVGIMASLGACIWLQVSQEGLYSGYIVWLASMVLLAVAGGCFASFASDKGMRGMAAYPPPQVLPDPSVFALFNQPRGEQPIPTKVRAGTPPSDRPSSQQPPCSPSS